MPTLQEINNRIHSIPTPSELESSFASIKSDIETVLSQPDDGFNENYYKNHTGRELFRKLNNFGLINLIFDSYDSGFRPTAVDGLSSGSSGGSSTEDFNISTIDTEANISSSTPTNPSGEVTIAYGTDTEDFYIWDGSSWYVYKNI